MPARKCVKYDDIILETEPRPLESIEQDFSVLEDDQKNTKKADSLDPLKGKKNKRKNRHAGNSTDPSTAVGSGFKPFNYAKANYNKFISAGQKNLKALLNSKITFGTNKKVRASFICSYS